MVGLNWTIHPGRLEDHWTAALRRIGKHQVLERIEQRDYTLWKPTAEGIIDRLGWLNCPRESVKHLAGIGKVVDDLRNEGFDRALLLGMGGSSLAPDVFARTFKPGKGYLSLSILDSTVPGAILAAEAAHDPAKTIYIVSSKSGDTVETISLFKYFHHRARTALGDEKAGEHFIAITDPGSSLADTAYRLRFRHVFLGDPSVGGRFSALSVFGLFPAALLGIRVERLLHRAAETLDEELATRGGPAAAIGAFLGGLSLHGVDKATFLLSPALESFGDWVEQLIAESLGKEGRGVVPLVGEEPGPPSVYGRDRLFVRIGLTGEDTDVKWLPRLKEAGFPVVEMEIGDLYDLGRVLVIWELAVAVAAFFLQVNPFDQPDVEAAKALARRIMAKIRERSGMPWGRPDYADGDLEVWGATEGGEPAEMIDAFLTARRPGDYVALQLYVAPSDETTRFLRDIRKKMRERYGLAVTAGYGPRYLHSTGQLHKGGTLGFFIQIFCPPQEDVPIPDEECKRGDPITFGVLAAAQCHGDREALIRAGRPILHISWKGASFFPALTPWHGEKP